MAGSDLILLDLDRTLLDTDRFSALVRRTAATLSGSDGTAVCAAWADANVGQGRHHRFELAAFAAHLGLSCDALEQEVLAHLPGPSMLYPDAYRLLAHLNAQQVDYAVLTFGETRMQALKLEAVPALHGIPAHITAVAKRDYIRATWPQRRGILVDDKSGQRLPDGWTEVTLTRTGTNGPQQVSPGRFVIGSLDEVPPIVARRAGRAPAQPHRTLPAPAQHARVRIPAIGR